MIKVKAAFRQHLWLLLVGFGALALAFYSREKMAALIIVSIVCIGKFTDFMVASIDKKDSDDD
jgi:hypothetical protein